MTAVMFPPVMFICFPNIVRYFDERYIEDLKTSRKD